MNAVRTESPGIMPVSLKEVPLTYETIPLCTDYRRVCRPASLGVRQRGYRYRRQLPASNSLVVLNYGKYLDASAIKMFEQETGIKIKLEEYESPRGDVHEVFCRFHQLRCRAHLGLYGGAA